MYQLPESLQYIILSYLIDIVDFERFSNINWSHSNNASYIRYKLPRFSSRLWLQGMDQYQLSKSAYVIQRLFINKKDRLANVIRRLKMTNCLNCQIASHLKIQLKLEYISKTIKSLLINEWHRLVPSQYIRYIENYLNATSLFLAIKNVPIRYIYNIYKQMVMSNLSERGWPLSERGHVVINQIHNQSPIRSVMRINHIVLYNSNYPQTAKNGDVKSQFNRYYLNHILRRRALLKRRAIIIMPELFNYHRALKRALINN